MTTTENVTVLNQNAIGSGYHLLQLQSRKIAPAIQPGQFVHLRVPCLGEALLRRPFSVFKVGSDTMTILYREVGQGTRAMRNLRTGDNISLLGPLGRGFPSPDPARFPVLVAGGYGIAALYLTAERTPVPGMIFVGGAEARDIFCVNDFEQIHWTTHITTEDGSLGTKGLVTTALSHWLETERGDRVPELFACGPLGMLRVISSIAKEHGLQAWLSMDRNMGCGLGACLACVQKVRVQEDDDSESWVWARICTEGPVFNAADILWSDES